MEEEEKSALVFWFLNTTEERSRGESREFLSKEVEVDTRDSLAGG